MKNNKQIPLKVIKLEIYIGGSDFVTFHACEIFQVISFSSFEDENKLIKFEKVTPNVTNQYKCSRRYVHCVSWGRIARRNKKRRDRERARVTKSSLFFQMTFGTCAKIGLERKHKQSTTTKDDPLTRDIFYCGGRKSKCIFMEKFRSTVWLKKLSTIMALSWHSCTRTLSS